jgi:hypothetical protein
LTHGGVCKWRWTLHVVSRGPGVGAGGGGVGRGVGGGGVGYMSGVVSGPRRRPQIAVDISRGE